jgi:TRAP-type mannitol/chloroaromatic compound transport system permease small subunit
MHNLANSIISGIEGLIERQGRICSFLIVIAAFQVCYELTLRYLFNAPTIWGLELTTYLCASTYVMAGSYAYKRDQHIRIDIIFGNWAPRTQAIFDALVTDLILFFFCGVLVYESGSWTWEAIVEGRTSGTIWDPAIWPMRLILFLGSLGLLLQGLAKFIKDLRMALKGKS